jgi:vacuolar-type H+-ATPase subunit H
MDMAGDNGRIWGDEGSVDDDLRPDLGRRDEAPNDPLSGAYEPNEALDGAFAPPEPAEEPAPERAEDSWTDATMDHPAVPAADASADDESPAADEEPAPAPSSSDEPERGTTPAPSAQHFQDVIALRREAEEAAAAALSERREATSQASRIIEEALRAAENLHADAQRSLDEKRTAAETEASTILERARAEAAEIIKAGENDVLEAQRLRREAGAERDRLNAELERIRRTAQEELFAEANRHTARMDEIRTRVLHGVEAATDSLRASDRGVTRADGEPAAVEARPTFVTPPPAEPAAAQPATQTAAQPAAPEPTREPTREPTHVWSPPQPAPAPAAPTAPAAPAPTAEDLLSSLGGTTPAPGIPANAPITPYTPGSSSAPAVSPDHDRDDEPHRKRGWRRRS